MRALRLAVLAALAAACGPQQPSKAGLHKDCASPTETCSYGQQCLHYTNFAGQPIATCEITCLTDEHCPEPLVCASVSEGPAQKICQ
jgi:hypothetical protein